MRERAPDLNDDVLFAYEWLFRMQREIQFELGSLLTDVRSKASEMVRDSSQQVGVVKIDNLNDMEELVWASPEIDKERLSLASQLDLIRELENEVYGESNGEVITELAYYERCFRQEQ